MIVVTDDDEADFLELIEAVNEAIWLFTFGEERELMAEKVQTVRDALHGQEG